MVICRGIWYLFSSLVLSDPSTIALSFQLPYYCYNVLTAYTTTPAKLRTHKTPMANTDVQEPAPAALPDYLTDPDAVLKDAQAKWRYGRAPDYSKTRKFYAESE